MAWWLCGGRHLVIGVMSCLGGLGGGVGSPFLSLQSCTQSLKCSLWSPGWPFLLVRQVFMCCWYSVGGRLGFSSGAMASSPSFVLGRWRSRCLGFGFGL